MKMQMARDDYSNKLIFKGEIDLHELATLRLDRFDRMVLDDCHAKGRTAADWLLGLELIFRRAQEQQVPAEVPVNENGSQGAV